MATLGSGFLSGFAQEAWNSHQAGNPLSDVFFDGVEGGVWGAALGGAFGSLFRAAPPFFRALASNCFVDGTPILIAGDSENDNCPSGISTMIAVDKVTKSIETIQVGERVDAYNPEARNYEPIKIDESWRLISLDFHDQSSQPMKMTLLRNKNWLAKYGFNKIGDTQTWAVPEIGMEGHATLVDVSKEINVVDGPGNIVTGTFTREVTDKLVSIKIAGQESTLTGTASHRIWSESSLGFKAMGEIVVGEQLRTNDGIFLVEEITEQTTRRRVNNLEIDGEHAYFAGDASVLVHNANYASLNAVSSGPVAELGRKLAGQAKSLYAIAGNNIDTWPKYGATQLSKPVIKSQVVPVIVYRQ